MRGARFLTPRPIESSKAVRTLHSACEVELFLAMKNWESLASAKRASLLSLIPSKWRLDLKEVPSTSKLRDFTAYVPRFLDPRELQITNASSDAILANIRAAEWSAVEVTRAFCHCAAIAHQLVS